MQLPTTKLQLSVIAMILTSKNNFFMLLSLMFLIILFPRTSAYIHIHSLWVHQDEQNHRKRRGATLAGQNVFQKESKVSDMILIAYVDDY